MSVAINSAINTYTYTYQQKLMPKLDKNDDAAWSRDEVKNYADAYNKATGKTLDVDKIMETYANGDGVIDYKSQLKMQEDDALGFKALQSAADTAAAAASKTTTTTNTSPAASTPVTTTQAQKDAIYEAVNRFTFDYSGKLQPKLDKDNDGLWSKDELNDYASAYKKATGKTLDVDALIKQYGNEDGFISPKNQTAMKEDDALGLSTLKSALNNITPTSYYVENPVSKDTTITSGRKATGGASIQDLLSNMSTSGKMSFSAMIQRTESQQNMLNSFLSGSAGSSLDLFSLANARTNATNTYKLQMAQGGSVDSLYSAMSGNAMNFTI